MIVTHSGKLGDFICALPVASWIYKQSGQKVDFMLPAEFPPFQKIESLLKMQPMTGQVRLVNFRPRHYRRGGQPYRLIPACFGWKGDYINLGFRNYTGKGFWKWKDDLPDKFIPEYYAEEYGLEWDRDFVLELGEVDPVDFEVQTEQLNIPGAKVIDLNNDILANARLMKAARVAHSYFCGMSAILYFARVPFVLYRSWQNPRTEFYHQDKSRFELKKVWIKRNGKWITPSRSRSMPAIPNRLSGSFIPSS